jgi:hypothetical protein
VKVALEYELHQKTEMLIQHRPEIQREILNVFSMVRQFF